METLKLLPGKLRFDLHSANSFSMSQEKKTLAESLHLRGRAFWLRREAGQDKLALALKWGNGSFVELMLPIPAASS